MTHSPPIVSVIVPHLNQLQYLDRCLKTLSAQSFDANRYEVIVVDNESTESPAALCEAFPTIRLETERAAGPGPARNKGAQASRGTILAFIDADCLADVNWLAVIARAFDDEDVRIVAGDVRVAVDEPTRLTAIEAYESVFAYRQEEYVARFGFGGTGNLAMRKNVYWAVGPFAGIDVAEDREWGRRASEAGYRVRYLPEMIVLHPAHQSLRELYIKWDRHIDHDFAERTRGVLGSVAWAVRALLVAGSPLFEVGRVVRSPRLSSWRERWQAILALIKVRFHRSARMLGLVFGLTEMGAARRWNRA